MNTTDYLIASDVASGVTAVVLEKVSGHISNANLWKPLLENTVLSILGRMGQSYLAGKTFSTAGTDGKEGTPYIRTAQGRSSLIIYISDMIIQYIMKNTCYESLLFKQQPYRTRSANYSSNTSMQCFLYETLFSGCTETCSTNHYSPAVQELALRVITLRELTEVCSTSHYSTN